jgi:hypothetical protein
MFYVVECSHGSYGYNCNESCDGCLSDSCDKEHGVCTDASGCKPGWLLNSPWYSHRTHMNHVRGIENVKLQAKWLGSLTEHRLIVYAFNCFCLLFWCNNKSFLEHT